MSVKLANINELGGVLADTMVANSLSKLKRVQPSHQAKQISQVAEIRAIHDPILGVTPEILAAKSRVRKLAGYPCNALLVGESGTGKELFAHLIHDQEQDAHRPFITVNCAAIPDELIESVLFGHEKGSFTGAIDKRIGKFELANGGDIFLDEISSLSLNLQTKLLRVLENKEIERVGGNATIQLSFRVISATNHNLEQLISAGQFREDLYFRLKGVEVHLPPLRERREDIKLLVDHYLRKFANGHRKSISEAALKVLFNHEWRGNVRELRNCIQSLVVLTEGLCINVHDVHAELTSGGSGSLDSLSHNAANDISKIGEIEDQATSKQASLKTVVEDYERQVILNALKRNHWSKTRTCDFLGITRNMLYRKIESLGILV